MDIILYLYLILITAKSMVKNQCIKSTLSLEALSVTKEKLAVNNTFDNVGSMFQCAMLCQGMKKCHGFRYVSL